ncbi:MAG: ABC transporter permease subunit [Anaerolineae bacterium]
MINDILTVMWKERRGMFRYQGSRTRLLMVLVSPLLMAIVFPLQAGPAWVKDLDSVIIAVFAPIILVSITIPDSFAGERERHTLGTLLASCLPDRAILFGKVAVSVAFAWGVTLAAILLGLVIVNVAHWEGKLLLLTPTIALADFGLSFLLGTLAAGAGVLISLRSHTVQEATQTLTAVLLLPPMLLGMFMTLLQDRVREFIGAFKGEQILLIVVAILAVIDVVVFVAAMARFQRSRLYLD